MVSPNPTDEHLSSEDDDSSLLWFSTMNQMVSIASLSPPEEESPLPKVPKRFSASVITLTKSCLASKFKKSRSEANIMHVLFKQRTRWESEESMDNLCPPSKPIRKASGEQTESLLECKLRDLENLTIAGGSDDTSSTLHSVASSAA